MIRRTRIMGFGVAVRLFTGNINKRKDSSLKKQKTRKLLGNLSINLISL